MVVVMVVVISKVTVDFLQNSPVIATNTDMTWDPAEDNCFASKTYTG